jgi:hypothetical protein
MRRNDQEFGSLRQPRLKRCHQLRASSCARASRATGRRRAAGQHGARNSEGLGVALAGATASAPGLPRPVEQPARGAAAGTFQRQPTLDIHDAATARRRPATIQSMACHAAGAATVAASTLAGIQVAAARTATRSARILQSIPSDAAGKAAAIAPAMAANDAGATASCGAGHARGSAAASDSALAVSRSATNRAASRRRQALEVDADGGGRSRLCCPGGYQNRTVGRHRHAAGQEAAVSAERAI